MDALVAAAAESSVAQGRSAAAAIRTERNRLLTEAFGSAKNQKQQRALAASQVDHTQVAGASAVLGQVKRDAKASDPLEQAKRRAAKQGRDPSKVVSVEEDAAMGTRRRVFPQFHMDAETPAEAFPLDGLISTEEQAALGEYAGRMAKALVAEAKRASGGADAGAASGGGGGEGAPGAPEDGGVGAFAHAVGMHPLVRDYLQELAGLSPDRKTRREQSKLLAFLDVALRIRSAGNMLVGRVAPPPSGLGEAPAASDAGAAAEAGGESSLNSSSPSAAAPASSSSSTSSSSSSSSDQAATEGQGQGPEGAGADTGTDQPADGEDAVTDAGDPRAIRELRQLPQAAGAAMLRKFAKKSREKSSRFKVVWVRDREAAARLDVYIMVGLLHLYSFAIPVGVLPAIANALAFTPSILRARFAQVGARESQSEKAGMKTKCIVLQAPLVFPSARTKKSKAR